jgi:hypothetical protein
LVVPDKAERVKNFHDNTIEALAEVIGAAGLMHPSEIRPAQLHRRISPTETRNYAELYPVLPENALLSGEAASTLHHAWESARSESFQPVAA